ncbi:nonstructural protein 2 [Barn owl parvovirus]|uniref:Nonstructural protein 2 n=1 Tax=Barn owl parvovirus TaxID=3070825 RepID=A0A7T1JQG6_9VIRU|nr:nonstructural protein 2 [Chaphamaparvovirus gyb-MR2/2015/HUN]QPN96885.1 nonstructural protein 2 [Chaphamaparvovirus gyb-MR2/2015/HUN]
MNLTIACINVLTILDVVTEAANAIIAQEAAAARLLLASQHLAECRERTNPYLPGNSWGGLGPSRTAMWAPDPCLEELREYAGATTAHQEAVAAAQIANAPTAQDLSSAPAPQLSSAYDPPQDLDPAIPESEGIVPSPAQNNMWSPTVPDDVMVAISETIEAMTPEIEEDMEVVLENMNMLLHWMCWRTPKKVRQRRMQFLPKNQDWIGRWTP